MSYLRKYGSRLINNGYQIIPIKQGEKRPAMSSWQKVDATQKMLEGWLSNGLSSSGAGILTKYTPAVDIDVHDEEIVKEMVEFVHNLLGPSLLRTGLPPKTLIPFRTDKPFKKISSSEYTDYLGDKHKVEILGDGQQFVAFAIHPDTKEPYVWKDGKSIADIPHDGLPLLTEEKAQEIVNHFEKIAGREEWEKVSDGRKGREYESSSDPLENYTPPRNELPAGHDPLKNVKKRFDWSFNRIRETLFCLDPDMPEPDWAKVGMGMYHQFDFGTTSERRKANLKEGFNLWVEWSSKGEKFNQKELAGKSLSEKREILFRKWRGFKANLKKVNPITFATIYEMVKRVRSQVAAEIIHKPVASDDELNNKRIIPIRNLRETAGGELVPLDWLVDGVLEAKSLCMFFGPPGCGKSFIALDLGLHIAWGRDWHGFEVKKPGNVLFVASEGVMGMRIRQRAWLQHYGIELDSFKEDPGFDSIEESVDLFKPDGVSELVESIDRHISATSRTPDVLMIDTLARNFGDGDENSTRDMNIFINHIKRYLIDRYGCAVILIHHSGHQNKERARGSISSKGAVSSEYGFDSLPKEGDQARLKVSCTKIRDADPIEDIFFILKKIKLGDPADDFRDNPKDNLKKNVVSLVPEKTNTPPKDDSPQPVIEEVPVKGKQKSIFDLLINLTDDQEWIERDAFRDVAIQQELVRDTKDFRKILHELRKKELVDEVDGKVKTLDPFSK